jgi:hypothetical protein
MTVPEKRKAPGVIELLAQLQSGQIAVDEITTEERRLAVSYLRLEGYTQEEMAKIFEVHRATIGRDEKIMAERAAKMIKDLKPQAVVAGLLGWAKHITAKAMKEKDYALVWRVQKELVDELTSLGLMGRRSDSGLAVFLGEQGKTVYVTHWGNEDPDERPALPAPKNDESEDNN